MNCFLGLEALPGALKSLRSRLAWRLGGTPGGKSPTVGNVNDPALVGEGPDARKDGGYIEPGFGPPVELDLGNNITAAASRIANSFLLSAIIDIISKLEFPRFSLPSLSITLWPNIPGRRVREGRTGTKADCSLFVGFIMPPRW